VAARGVEMGYSRNTRDSVYLSCVDCPWHHQQQVVRCVFSADFSSPHPLAVQMPPLDDPALRYRLLASLASREVMAKRWLFTPDASPAGSRRRYGSVLG
jgi:hypothetical protein